jgi:hypothetical protein
MKYVLCHTILMEQNARILSQGKSKGLLNYNNKHLTIFLEEQVCQEHVDMYKRCGTRVIAKDIMNCKSFLKIKIKYSSISYHRVFQLMVYNKGNLG